MRFRLVLLTCCLLPLGTLPVFVGEATAQSAAAQECLRINASPPDMFDREQRKRANKVWIETCMQAMTTDGGDLRIKRALARSYGVDGQRAEEIKLLRELGAQNHADALFEIYDTHKSYDRSDVNKPQLVTRAEAEQSLRKAAELGHPYSMWMLAVLLDRGATVKRDPAGAIHWATRAMANPPKETTAADIELRLGNFLAKSANADERTRGIALLEKYASAGRGDAKANLAIAIRRTDPARARALLEEALRTYPGHALPTLTEMLIKGEGGAADPKRAVSLLSGRTASDVPAVRGALGRLYIEGKLVPRDMPKGIELLDGLARWDHDARIEVMGLLASNPDLRISYPGGFLYQATEAAELGEPGAKAALIALKLSSNAQFSDKPGGCALAEGGAQRPPECRAN